MNYPERDLHGPNQAKAIIDLIQSIFISELLRPSKILWIHYAWVSDIEVIDNTSRKFAWLNPSWPATKIKFIDILGVLLSKGAKIRLIIRRDVHNEYILRKLEMLRNEFQTSIEWRVIDRFHDKGMVGDHYFLTGTMNLTKSGVNRNTEHIYFRTDPAKISEQKIHLEREWEQHLK